METKDLENGIRMAMAKSFVENLSPEAKNELFEGAMVRSFEKLTESYSVEKEIQAALKADMLGYAAEYVGRPETQAALKTAAHKRVDDLIDAVIEALGHELERLMKSGYSRFMAKEI